MEKLLNNLKLIIVLTLGISLPAHAMELSNIEDVAQMQKDQQQIPLCAASGLGEDNLPANAQMQHEVYDLRRLKKSQRKAATLARNIRAFIAQKKDSHEDTQIDIAKFKEKNIPIINCLINDTQAIQQQYSLRSDIQENLKQFESTLKKSIQPTFWEIENITKADNARLRGLRNTLEKVQALYFGADVRAALSSPLKKDAALLLTTQNESSAGPKARKKACSSPPSIAGQEKLNNIVNTVSASPKVVQSLENGTIPISNNASPKQKKPALLSPTEAEALLNGFQHLSSLREEFRNKLLSFQKIIEIGNHIIDTYETRLDRAPYSIDRLQSTLEQLYAPMKVDINTTTDPKTLFTPDTVEIQKYTQLKKWVDNDLKEKIEDLRIRKTHNFINNIRHRGLLSNTTTPLMLNIIAIENNIKDIQEQACAWGLTDQNNSTCASIMVQINKTMSSLPGNDYRKNEWLITIHALNELTKSRDKRITKEKDVKEKVIKDITNIRRTIDEKLSILQNNKSSDTLKEQAMIYIRNHTFIFVSEAKKNLPDQSQEQINATERAWEAFRRDWDHSQKPWYLRIVSWFFGWGPEEIKQKEPVFRKTTSSCSIL